MADPNTIRHKPPKRVRIKEKFVAGETIVKTSRGDVRNRDSHNQPMPAKKAISRLPVPQFQRILQRHVAGASIREISRAEHRSREAVTKIVRSSEMGDFVERSREAFYGLAGSNSAPLLLLFKS